MHYELNRTSFFWHWTVPQFGEGRDLTKGGAKRAAEALIARIKKAELRRNPSPRLPSAAGPARSPESVAP